MCACCRSCSCPLMPARPPACLPTRKLPTHTLPARPPAGLLTCLAHQQRCPSFLFGLCCRKSQTGSWSSWRSTCRPAASIRFRRFTAISNSFIVQRPRRCHCTVWRTVLDSFLAFVVDGQPLIRACFLVCPPLLPFTPQLSRPQDCTFFPRPGPTVSPNPNPPQFCKSLPPTLPFSPVQHDCSPSPQHCTLDSSLCLRMSLCSFHKHYKCCGCSLFTALCVIKSAGKGSGVWCKASTGEHRLRRLPHILFCTQVANKQATPSKLLSQNCTLEGNGRISRQNRSTRSVCVVRGAAAEVMCCGWQPTCCLAISSGSRAGC